MARRGRCGGAIVPVAALVVALAGSTSAAASFTRLGNLSAPGEDAIDPQLASAADGDAIAVWERSATSTLGPTENLSSSGHDAFATQVASAANDATVVAWQRPDGANSRVQGAAGP